jgi:hypothetical protein
MLTLKRVEAEEYAARWEVEYERVKTVRDQLAAEMREVYPAAVAQLVSLFQRMAVSDRECSRIAAIRRRPAAGNDTAPSFARSR